MKLGFLSVPFANWPLEQVARWAKANGFDALEVACWPAAAGDPRRYAVWRELFEIIPSRALGLNFGERILHVHAKDLEVRMDALYEHGVMSLGMGWQVPRLPGLGQNQVGPLLRRPVRGRLRRVDHRRA
jgi:sugar phosphate isomerase/epimerase